MKPYHVGAGLEVVKTEPMKSAGRQLRIRLNARGNQAIFGTEQIRNFSELNYRCPVSRSPTVIGTALDFLQEPQCRKQNHLNEI